MVCIWIASCADARLAAGGVVHAEDGVVQRGHDAAREQHQRLLQHRGQRQPRAGGERMCFRQRQHQRLARHPQVRQARRREAGRVQHEASVDSPRASASSCTSPVASISSSCTCGCCSRQARSHSGSSEKPTVETKAIRRWPIAPPAAARAPAPAWPGRGPAARAPAAAAPHRPSVSSTLRLLRSNRRTASRRSSWAMACVSGGWVMCRRRAARPKCSSSATATNWRHSRSSTRGSVICRAY
jgi:hypothetical protein